MAEKNINKLIEIGLSYYPQYINQSKKNINNHLKTSAEFSSEFADVCNIQFKKFSQRYSNSEQLYDDLVDDFKKSYNNIDIIESGNINIEKIKRYSNNTVKKIAEKNSTKYIEISSNQQIKNQNLQEQNRNNLDEEKQKKDHLNKLFKEYDNLKTFSEKTDWFNKNIYNISNLSQEEQQQHISMFEKTKSYMQELEKLPKDISPDQKKIEEENIRKKHNLSEKEANNCKLYHKNLIKLSDFKKQKNQPNITATYEKALDKKIEAIENNLKNIAKQIGLNELNINEDFQEINKELEDEQELQADTQNEHTTEINSNKPENAVASTSNAINLFANLTNKEKDSFQSSTDIDLDTQQNEAPQTSTAINLFANLANKEKDSFQSSTDINLDTQQNEAAQTSTAINLFANLANKEKEIFETSTNIDLNIRENESSEVLENSETFDIEEILQEEPENNTQKTYSIETKDNPIAKFFKTIKNKLTQKKLTPGQTSKQQNSELTPENYTQNIEEKQNIFSKIKNAISKFTNKNKPIGIDTAENNKKTFNELSNTIDKYNVSQEKLAPIRSMQNGAISLSFEATRPLQNNDCER